MIRHLSELVTVPFARIGLGRYRAFARQPLGLVLEIVHVWVWLPPPVDASLPYAFSLFAEPDPHPLRT